jgi:hypothetical protein
MAHWQARAIAPFKIGVSPISLARGESLPTVRQTVCVAEKSRNPALLMPLYIIGQPAIPVARIEGEDR